MRFIEYQCCPYVTPIFLSFYSLETYWQSNGTTPHLINIQFLKKVNKFLSVCNLLNYGASRCTVVTAFCVIMKHIYFPSFLILTPLPIGVATICQVSVSQICFYLDFNLDDSYTAKKVSIRSGTSSHDLIDVTAIELNEPVRVGL